MNQGTFLAQAQARGNGQHQGDGLDEQRPFAQVASDDEATENSFDLEGKKAPVDGSLWPTDSLGQPRVQERLGKQRSSGKEGGASREVGAMKEGRGPGRIQSPQPHSHEWTHLWDPRAAGVGSKAPDEQHSQEGEEHRPEDVEEVVEDVTQGSLSGQEVGGRPMKHTGLTCRAGLLPGETGSPRHVPLPLCQSAAAPRSSTQGTCPCPRR